MKNTTTLTLACCAAFLAQVGISSYLPAVPAIAQALPAAEDHVALALAVYLVGMALPMLLWGSLGERLGRKPVLLAALALYALASAAIPSAFNVESFLALRLTQGLGAGGVSVMARVLVRDSFSGALLAKGLSWLGMTFVIALGIGQFAGSMVQLAFGWEAIFYTLAIGAVALMLVLQRVTFPALVKSDSSLAARRIYATILRHPPFLHAALAGGLGYGVIIAFNTCAPLILQGRFEWSATQYGWLGWPISAAYLAGGVDGQLVRCAHGPLDDDELGRGPGVARQRRDAAGQCACQWARGAAVAAVLPGSVGAVDELPDQFVPGQ